MIQRPKYSDTTIKLVVAQHLCKIICKWLDSHNEYYEPDELQKDCNKIMEYAVYGDDGYKFARTFDKDYGYDPDSALVEELDHIMNIWQNEFTKSVTQWVKDNNIQPQYEINQVVTTNTGFTGKISSINNLTACYRIEVTPTSTRLVPYELVTLTEQTNK